MVFLWFVRTVRSMWNKPNSRMLIGASGFTMLMGTVFYRFVEDLSWVDSWYFTIVTLTTVGYGDIYPSTTAGRLFTSFYLLVGVGLILAMLNAVVANAAADRKERREQSGE